MQAGGSGGSRGSRPSQSSQTSQTSQSSQSSHTSGGPRRQSGAPTSGSQPSRDPTGLGLPDLSGYAPAPRMTPRVAAPAAPDQPEALHVRHDSQAPAPSAPAAQTDQPHTLGVTAKLARLRATGSPSLPQAPATVTQQMRAVEPPDIARQTLEEQKMLAHELMALPDTLEASGLAKTHEHSYRDAARAYVALANETWIAIAEERLEQRGAEEEYRQSAIAIGRRVMRMRNEAQLAASNTQFPLPRKRPFFWRRRMRLLRERLRDWQAHLSAPTDPRAMGRSLARLRGASALADASNVELALWGLCMSAVGDTVMIFWLGLVIVLAAVLGQGNFASVAALALAILATLAVRIALGLLVRRGPARLDYLFALSVFSPLRSPRADKPGSRIIAGLLRAWGIFATLAGLLGMLAALAYNVWQLAAPIFQQRFAAPTMALGWLDLVGSDIAQITYLPALVGLAAVAALALPLLLISALRYMGELGGNVAWQAAARRYALAPALHGLLFLSAGAVAALAFFAPQLELRQFTLTTLTLGPISQPITLQTVALFVVPALILLLGLDIPFRIGVARWRRYWLTELTARRADIDAHVRRLSAVNPQTGEQDASEENLRAMQYDLVLVQFYNTRTEETRHATSAPYGWLAGIGFVILLAVVALLVDGVAQQLAHVLLGVG